MREMRDGEAGGRAAVLVQQDQVGRGRGMARRAQQRQNGVAAVQPDAVGQEQPDLFGELQQARRGVARGGDEDLGVDDPREVCVFVVELGRLVGVGRVRFVVFEVLAQLCVVCDVFGERLLRAIYQFAGL